MFDAYQDLLEVEVHAQKLKRPLREVPVMVSDMVGYCLLTSLQAQNAWKLQSECSIFYRL
jgi:hypothetical protein